jgi:transcriptional regulatory protein RtcR
MNKEATQAFLRFAESDDARWRANFRDLNAAVTRIATLAVGGQLVEEEVARLKNQRRPCVEGPEPANLNGLVDSTQLDEFDRAQLEAVVQICRKSKSISDAGRKLFAVSRNSKSQPNDADRLRKYLARFNLVWDHLRE